MLLRSGSCALAQSGVRGLRDLSVVLPLLALLGFLGALALAAGARRRALLEIGVGILIAALVSLLLRRYVESYVVENLVHDEGLRPAAHEVLAILTAGWRSRALWLLVTGALVLLAGLLAGPARWAVWLRRRLAAPLEHHIGWFLALAFAGVLAIAAVGPTRTPGQTLPLLAEFALAIAGVFALRTQIRRELVHGFGGGSPAPESDASLGGAAVIARGQTGTDLDRTHGPGGAGLQREAERTDDDSRDQQQVRSEHQDPHSSEHVRGGGDGGA